MAEKSFDICGPKYLLQPSQEFADLLTDNLPRYILQIQHLSMIYKISLYLVLYLDLYKHKPRMLIQCFRVDFLQDIYNLDFCKCVILRM
jgi:hypothetical protein